MATVVYVLCALASIACAVLLLSSWRTSRAPLLLWTLLCFVGLALNNILLFVDKVIAPDVDLSVLRSVPALAGVAALVYGLVRGDAIVSDFLLGATAMGCLTIALFFFGFWRETGGRFFALFSLAFAIFAVNRCILLFLDEAAEGRTYAYAIRLLAFGLIVAAIIDNNRRPAD